MSKKYNKKTTCFKCGSFNTVRGQGCRSCGARALLSADSKKLNSLKKLKKYRYESDIDDDGAYWL